tara:strand:+ start:781 stop:1083 length:303 start_codon:yes stop_codon:yes gene_type:complete
MFDNFKNINILTNVLKRKIYNKNDNKLIIIMENWKQIVGNEYYPKTNPVKVTRDKKLKVEVSNEILLDFQFSTCQYLREINLLLGNDNNITKIMVVQKTF